MDSAQTIRSIESKAYGDIVNEGPFNLAFYQREYKWDRESITSIFNDLFKTYENYNCNSDQHVESPQYFMGSFVIAKRHKGSLNDLVDGQQRLTTLSLFFLALYNHFYDGNYDWSHDGLFIATDLLLRNNETMREKVQNEPTQYCVINKEFYVNAFTEILSQTKDGKKLENANINSSDANENNIYEAYQILYNLIETKNNKEEYDEEFFYTMATWAKKHIQFAFISVESPSEAYKVFEVLNDRGSSLSQSELLKGLLLSRFTEIPDKLKDLEDSWNEISKNVKKYEFIKELYQDWKQNTIRLGSDEEDKFWFNFLKAYFLGDKELNENNFYRWTKDHLNADSIDDQTIENMIKSAKTCIDEYKKIRLSMIKRGDYEFIYFSSRKNLTIPSELQIYPLLAAIPYNNHDAEERIKRVSWFLDNLGARSRYSSLDGSTNQEARLKPIIDNVTTKIKETHSLQEVDGILKEHLDSIRDQGFNQENIQDNKSGNFENLSEIDLNRKNDIRNIFIRLSICLDEVASGTSIDYFKELKDDPAKAKWQIEHLWPENMTGDEIKRIGLQDKEDFETYRNKIGALTMIEGTLNQKAGDKHFSVKSKGEYNQSSIWLSKMLAQEWQLKKWETDSETLTIKETRLLTIFNKLNQNIALLQDDNVNFTKKHISTRSNLYRALAQYLWRTDYYTN